MTSIIFCAALAPEVVITGTVGVAGDSCGGVFPVKSYSFMAEGGGGWMTGADGGGTDAAAEGAEEEEEVLTVPVDVAGAEIVFMPAGPFGFFCGGCISTSCNTESP